MASGSDAGGFSFKELALCSVPSGSILPEVSQGWRDDAIEILLCAIALSNSHLFVGTSLFEMAR